MKITKEELKEIYYSQENKKTCEYLGITNATLITYLKKLGIPRKGKGNRRSITKIELEI
tara:strand:+ start:219 stop:395 length:177 start_codon:yes stop_codon:yes gene_type:complete